MKVISLSSLAKTIPRSCKSGITEYFGIVLKISDEHQRRFLVFLLSMKKLLKCT